MDNKMDKPNAYLTAFSSLFSFVLLFIAAAALPVQCCFMVKCFITLQLCITDTVYVYVNFILP